MLLFVGWSVFVWLAWRAYGPVGRLLAVASLGVLAAPLGLAAAGMAGSASGDARALLWAALVVWSVMALGVGWVKTRTT